MSSRRAVKRALPLVLALCVVAPNNPFVTAALAGQIASVAGIARTAMPVTGSAASVIGGNAGATSAGTVALRTSGVSFSPAAKLPVFESAPRTFVATPAPSAVARAAESSALAPAPALRSVTAAAMGGDDAAPAEGDKTGRDAAPRLAGVFDGAKIKLSRPGDEAVETDFSSLSAVLAANPALLAGVNAHGRVRVLLPRSASAAEATRALRALGVDAPVKVAPLRSGVAGWLQRNVSVDLSVLKAAPRLLRESWTKPNKTDFAYLVFKTFMLNLGIRWYFTSVALAAGQIALPVALVSLAWYQIQDAVFTVFGQTYMKFVGRMGGMVRIGRLNLGDVAFTFLQLTAFDFLNRLVLGPIGQNPLVYTWAGLGLLLFNNLQGMLSGGMINPAISKAYRSGVIGKKTMLFLYQVGSLTMQYGVLAVFGYQHLYFLLTTGTLVASWLAYLAFTIFFKEIPGRDTGMGAPAEKSK